VYDTIVELCVAMVIHEGAGTAPRWTPALVAQSADGHDVPVLAVGAERHLRVVPENWFGKKITPTLGLKE